MLESSFKISSIAYNQSRADKVYTIRVPDHI